MKKIFAIALAIVMMMSLAIPASAATLDAETTSASADIIARYTSATESYAVISVDVTFGALSFLAVEPNGNVWNPETHKYDATATSGTQWIPTGNTVTVTNHSNKAVDVSVEATIDQENYAGITASFDKSDVTLATAVGTAVDAAPTDTWTLTISGAALGTALGGNDVAIGSVTVSIVPQY